MKKSKKIKSQDSTHKELSLKGRLIKPRTPFSHNTAYIPYRPCRPSNGTTRSPEAYRKDLTTDLYKGKNIKKRTLLDQQIRSILFEMM